jgi:prokaryotic YEATS domain
MRAWNHNVEPHKITKPIQLTAVWFVALLLLDSAFLVAASKTSQPAWMAPTLAISAIIFVPIFLIGVFLMQTVFRKELQEDPYYSEWLKRQEERFKGFKPENVQASTNTTAPVLQKSGEAEGDNIEKVRVQRYQDQKGLFLVHTWRPSRTHGQIADIVIWLHQHGKGPLTKDEIEKVEYHLGPKFFKTPQVKTNAHDQYKIEVSAYGPMLCLARIFIKGQAEPILVERYVNFEETPNEG